MDGLHREVLLMHVEGRDGMAEEGGDEKWRLFGFGWLPVCQISMVIDGCRLKLYSLRRLRRGRGEGDAQAVGEGNLFPTDP